MCAFAVDPFGWGELIYMYMALQQLQLFSNAKLHQQIFEECIEFINVDDFHSLKALVTGSRAERWLRQSGLDQQKETSHTNGPVFLLHWACMKKAGNCVCTLLEANASPNSQLYGEASSRETPLHIAVRNNSKACVLPILKNTPVFD